MPNAGISVNNLTVNFGAIRAVDGISFHIPKKSVFGFLGPNGAGKTTTIRLLLGLLQPTNGSIQVFGLDSQTQSREIRKISGVLLEHNGIYENLSAVDNLDFHGRLCRMSAKERTDRLQELLTHFELWDRRWDHVGTWSKGMKKKLALARALFHRPALLLLDEPTSGLDPIVAATLREDIVQLVAAGDVTVFLATHNLTEAETLCSLVGIVNKGKLLSISSPGELRELFSENQIEIRGPFIPSEAYQRIIDLPEVKSVIMGTDRWQIDLQPGAEAAAMVTILVQAGARINEVYKSKTSLEEAFLRIVKEA